MKNSIVMISVSKSHARRNKFGTYINCTRKCSKSTIKQNNTLINLSSPNGVAGSPGRMVESLQLQVSAGRLLTQSCGPQGKRLSTYCAFLVFASFSSPNTNLSTHFQMARACWCYFFCKNIELLDTVSWLAFYTMKVKWICGSALKKIQQNNMH